MVLKSANGAELTHIVKLVASQLTHLTSELNTQLLTDHEVGHSQSNRGAEDRISRLTIALVKVGCVMIPDAAALFGSATMTTADWTLHVTPHNPLGRCPYSQCIHPGSGVQPLVLPDQGGAPENCA